MMNKNLSTTSSVTTNNNGAPAAVFVERHKFFLGAMVLVITVAISGLFFFYQYRDQQNKLAQNDMFQAVYYFEQEDYDKALDGDGACAGLRDIVKEYRFTKAAHLANFYIGVSYMHQKEYSKAIDSLKAFFVTFNPFSTKDSLLHARAMAVVGDAHVALKEYHYAAGYYEDAANYKPNKAFSPVYLTKAALAHEANNNGKTALECYARIVRDYPDSVQYGEACKHVARLGAIKKGEGN
jgi:tetratricopeptide (TPR) repeat protein